MKVTFVGGPLDGQVEDVDITGEGREVIYWPPGAREEAPEGHVKVHEGLFEYLSRDDGSGMADYVAGIPKGTAGEPESFL